MYSLAELLEMVFLLFFHFTNTYNPILVLSGLVFLGGLFFLVLSFAHTLWNTHVTLKLGPILMITTALVAIWWNLPQVARGILAKWIERTPEEWMNITTVFLGSILPPRSKDVSIPTTDVPLG